MSQIVVSTSERRISIFGHELRNVTGFSVENSISLDDISTATLRVDLVESIPCIPGALPAPSRAENALDALLELSEYYEREGDAARSEAVAELYQSLGAIAL